MTVALGALYIAYGGLSWMQAAFYGVAAAVIGIIVRSAWKLGTMTMAGDRLLWGVFAVMAMVTAWTESEIAPPVMATLKVEGVDMAGQKPRLVTREMAAGATRVVAFGCGLGAAAPDDDKIEQWTDVPAVSDGLPAARAVIREHLERLLDGWSAA